MKNPQVEYDTLTHSMEHLLCSGNYTRMLSFTMNPESMEDFILDTQLEHIE